MQDHDHERHRAAKSLPLEKNEDLMTRMDINKDGFLSHEDYNLMAEQLAEYGCLIERQARGTQGKSS